MSTQVGRPTVIDDATVQKLEAAFRDGFSVTTACHLSGISRSTFYDHCDTDQEFSDKMDIAKEWVTEQAKKVVVQSINKGDLPTAKWWLERRARNEFGKDAADAEPKMSRETELFSKLIRDFAATDPELCFEPEGQSEQEDTE